MTNLETFKRLANAMSIERNAQQIEKAVKEGSPLYTLTLTTVQKTDSLLFKKYETSTLTSIFDHFSKMIYMLEEYQNTLPKEYKIVENHFTGGEQLYVKIVAENDNEIVVFTVSTTYMNETLNGFC